MFSFIVIWTHVIHRQGFNFWIGFTVVSPVWAVIMIVLLILTFDSLIFVLIIVL